MPSPVAKNLSPLSIQLGFPDYRKQPMEWDKHWARQIEFVYNGSRDFVNEVLVAGQIDQDAESLLSTHRSKILESVLTPA